MRTENIFIAHPTTSDQINALKAVVKALDVKFEIKRGNYLDNGSSKEELADNLKKGFEEMKLIKKGKLKTTPLKDFLDAL